MTLHSRRHRGFDLSGKSSVFQVWNAVCCTCSHPDDASTSYFYFPKASATPKPLSGRTFAGCKVGKGWSWWFAWTFLPEIVQHVVTGKRKRFFWSQLCSLRTLIELLHKGWDHWPLVNFSGAFRPHPCVIILADGFTSWGSVLLGCVAIYISWI